MNKKEEVVDLLLKKGEADNEIIRTLEKILLLQNAEINKLKKQKIVLQKQNRILKKANRTP